MRGEAVIHTSPPSLPTSEGFASRKCIIFILPSEGPQIDPRLFVNIDKKSLVLPSASVLLFNTKLMTFLSQSDGILPVTAWKGKSKPQSSIPLPPRIWRRLVY